MNFSKVFILRPVATSLIMIAIFLAGLLGWKFLPIAALPQVDYPTIVVSTFYPGASPDVMSTSITAPLELQFGEMAGLDQMISQSSGGASIITLRFQSNLEMDIAEQEVQAAINNAGSLIPSDLPAPPIYAKINPADAPVMTLGITSSIMTLPEVEDYVNTRLQQKLSQISGVGLVTLSGGNKKSYRIQVNIPKLTSYGIAIDTIRTIIGTINVNSPTGTFDGEHYATSLRMNGQISSITQLLNQIIAYQNNGPIRLKDVAKVVEGAENTQLAAWANNKPGLILNIEKQPGANVINVTNNIRHILPKLQNDLPPGIEIIPLTDRTSTIRSSIDDVEFDLLLAIFLVVSVIYFFLKNIPATIIPAITVPLSLIGTLGMMDFLNFSIDNLSLMALTIAAGFVVDDAIVVIENISRFIENGDDIMTSALKGTKEIGFTILSLTLSLIAVLIPLLFMSDIVGRLFHEFSMTLSITIILSALISLTLVPMMCARILSNKQSPKYDKKESYLQKIILIYEKILDWVLNHQTLTLMTFIFSLLLTFFLAWTIPKGFFPDQDTGIVRGLSIMPQSISFEAMKSYQQKIGEKILQDPDVENISSFIGVDGENTTLNTGRFLISLKPPKKRTSSYSDILDRLSHIGQTLPDTSLYLQPLQDLTLNTSVSPLAYQIIAEVPDIKDFNLWIPRILETFQQSSVFSQIESDLQPNGPAAYITLDRSNAARYSITPQTLDNLLYDSFGQRQVSTIYTQSNQYRVILEADPSLQHSTTALEKLYLPGISGNSGESVSGPKRQPTSGLVPLTQVTQLKLTTAPLLITRFNQFPATTISFNPAKGYTLGEAVNEIDKLKSKLDLPNNFNLMLEGTAASFKDSLKNELPLILIAIIVIYIVLGVLYESFIHPLTILSTLPSAGIGALIGLEIFRMPLDIMGIIGIVLLIGIVKKNAIMMIDFALQAERLEHLSTQEAIKKAALLRFRPILMTTLAALLGAIPLMIGMGTGSELRRPLGVAIVFGLMLSQLITLFTIPVIYIFMDHLALKIKKIFHINS